MGQIADIIMNIISFSSEEDPISLYKEVKTAVLSPPAVNSKDL